MLASTLTTIAVLLPVLLLAGLAKKLFAPLALTVAVAMIVSYFVSMFVTPVACRFVLGTKEPRGIGKKLGEAIERLADGYSRILRGALGVRVWIIVACVLLTAGAGWAATRLPTAFFPEIDESMERVYVRFSPGISLDEASRRVREMAKMLHQQLPKGEVELVLTNQGSPENARSAMTSPNDGPHMGFIRVALVDPEHRKHTQRQIADQMRALLISHYPGVEFLQWPGGLVASVFSNGYVAPIAIEIQNDNLIALEDQAHAVAEVARTIGGVRDIRVQLQTDYPELHVDTRRSQAGFVDVTARQAAQVTLDATLGNINTPSVWIDPQNGQAYYVVTYYDERDVPDTGALAQLPVRVTNDAKAIALSAYADIRRAAGPIAIERDHMKRVTEVYMQTEGRDVGSVAKELDERLAADPRTRPYQMELRGRDGSDADNLRRPRRRRRSGDHGRLHGHDDSVQVVALAVRHVVRHSRLSGGNHARPFGRRPGVFGDGTHGCSHGHRNRGFEWHPSGRRGQRESEQRRDQGGRDRRRRAHSFHADHDDQPRHRHRPAPHRPRAGGGDRGEPGTRARGCRRPDFVDVSIAVLGAVNLHDARQTDSPRRGRAAGPCVTPRGVRPMTIAVTRAALTAVVILIAGPAAHGADGSVRQSHRDSPDAGAPGAFLGPLPTTGSRGDSEAGHDYPLVTRPNGTLFYDSPQFSAAVATDGTVTFHDHRVRYSPRDAMLSFDLSDEFVRELAHGTLYPHEKANFLAATFGRRTTMAARAHSAEMRTALEDIPRRLDALWADTRYRRRERRRVIFLLWEEADTSTAAGRSADKIIEAWIREHLPLGSSDAYGKAELDAISRERAGHPPFRPYPSPLEMRSPTSRQSETAP